MWPHNALFDGLVCACAVLHARGHASMDETHRPFDHFSPSTGLLPYPEFEGVPAHVPACSVKFSPHTSKICQTS